MKQKTTNRGVAIQRNAERVKDLADETKERFAKLGKAAKTTTGHVPVLGERLDALEEFMSAAGEVLVTIDRRVTTAEMNDRPWWRKVRDWIAAAWWFRIEAKPGTRKGITVEEVEEDPHAVIVIDSHEVEEVEESASSEVKEADGG